MKDIYTVKLSSDTLKILKKIPLHVVEKLRFWIDDVGHRGLHEVRKIPGYHDEPLQGKRKNQRSIRLTRTYRAIYMIEADKTIQFVKIIEVSKHEY